MPVKLTSPNAESLLPVNGITLGYAEANIRQENRKDVLVMQIASGSHVAGVFTQNRFCAAPVTLCKTHLDQADEIRALVVNTGFANAGTGEQGLKDAQAICDSLGSLMNIEANQILPFSTGIILEPLPVDKIKQALPHACKQAVADNWLNAAEAIMTTDILPKAASKQVDINGETITITGMSKGSGMIHPNMATMLAYLTTDANISQSALDNIIQYAVSKSFNCTTVDGDTSTNDSFIMVATNQAANATITEDSPEFVIIRDALTDVAITLAQAIVRDGEGATKFITIQVEQGKNEGECRQVADAIAHSPLVKTAFFASDPNLGRILAAIGYAGIDDLEVNNIQLYLGDVLVSEHGGCAASYAEAQGQAVMAEEDITVRVVLNRGGASATVWTCDFSYDYVKINADYRS